MKRPVAFLCVLLLLTSTGSAAAMEPGQEPAQYISARPGESAALSTTSRDIANQLGLLPLVDELKSLSQVNSPSLESQLRRVQLKQKINEKVIIAALQVRGVTAAIEEQITDMDRLLGFMQDKRDRAIRINTITNGLGMGALNEVGQAGELKTQETMGEVVELAAGGLVVLLSGLALYQQSGVGNRRYIQPKPNMLARVLKCQHDQNSDFPEIVWRFLNSPAADPQNGNKTRVELLIQKWQRYKFIGSMNDPRSQPRLAALCNTHPSGRVNLSLLQDRIDLLSDLKAAIFQMDRALLDLLQNLAVD